jgi:hypothetical protein
MKRSKIKRIVAINLEESINTNQISEINTENKNIKTKKTRKKERISFKQQNNNLVSEENSKDILSQSQKNKSENNSTIKENKNEINNKKTDNNEFPLILINASNCDKFKPFQSNIILNNYDYDEAIIYDKRSIWRIFFIFLISQDNNFNIIFFNPPLELKPLRISIFIFNYSTDLALNALFYLSDNISDKYNYKGANKILFSLINNLTISLVSITVTIILLTFFQKLTESSEKIESIFREQDDKLKSDKNYRVNEKTKKEIKNTIKRILKCLKIKIIFFLFFEFLFLLFFLYYVTAFCQVYQSTQISWILDSISSYAMSLLLSLGISIFFSIIYKISIIWKIKILYKISIFAYSYL